MKGISYVKNMSSLSTVFIEWNLLYFCKNLTTFGFDLEHSWGPYKAEECTAHIKTSNPETNNGEWKAISFGWRFLAVNAARLTGPAQIKKWSGQPWRDATWCDVMNVAGGSHGDLVAVPHTSTTISHFLHVSYFNTSDFLINFSYRMTIGGSSFLSWEGPTYNIQGEPKVWLHLVRFLAAFPLINMVLQQLLNLVYTLQRLRYNFVIYTTTVVL